jgi:translation initiation factor IF-2
VVAVNKIDLADSNVDRVKGELAQEGLQPEDWGGETQFAEVSAKTQQNLDELLEKVLLVADLELEGLKANPNAEASGPIIESRLDVGRGPVATMLVQRGTLKVGDAVVAGDAHGRVKALFDYKGERQESAGPGDPIEILGFDKPPAAGELARVVENDREARELAAREGVEIRTYDVIYKLTEEIEQALVGKLAAVTTEETIGEAEVRETFRASRVGTIAGCMVTDGVIRRGANVRVIRDGAVIYTTTIDSLKRFQDDAREVAEGFECGLHLERFDDVKVGDVLEVFETREIERTSLDEAPTA